MFLVALLFSRFGPFFSLRPFPVSAVTTLGVLRASEGLMLLSVSTDKRRESAVLLNWDTRPDSRMLGSSSSDEAPSSSRNSFVYTRTML